MLEILTLKPDAFGLDISDLSLKIAKLKKKKGFLRLASFGETEINPGIIEEGEVKNEEALASIIKEAFLKVKGEKLKTKYLTCSLPEEKAFLQVIKMPKMKEEDIKKAVRFEAENYIPLPIEEVYLDFQTVQPFYNHLDHIDVLIAALPKKIVDPYINAIKKAGLAPLVLEVESQAISRAIIKGGVSPFPVLIIDLGATKTSFIIFSGYSLRFTSSISVSSRKLTEAVSVALKINFEEAEKLKFKYGADMNYSAGASSFGGKNAADIKFSGEGKKVFEAIVPSLTDLIEQIEKHLIYYQSHASHEHLPADGKGINKIFLCGGGANLKGLTDFISLGLKLPTELGNPWINILPEPLKEVPELSYEKSLSYTTALGLSFRGMRESAIKSF